MPLLLKVYFLYKIIFTVSNYTRKCTNPDEKGHSNENFTSSPAGSSGEQNENARAQTSNSKSLQDYFSENLHVITI